MSFPEAIDLRRVRMQLPRPSLPIALRGRRPSRWSALVALVLTALIAAGAYMLVRDSSLVKVERVEIVGLDGYYDRTARKAVTEEAMRMTTMNFDDQRIAEAAAAFVDVNEVKVETDFPHGVRLVFDVTRPVVQAKVNGRTLVLSQDGEIIEGARGVAALPKIEVSGAIENGHVVDGKAVGAARVLGAAPDLLLRKVESLRWGKLGLIVTLEKGVILYFGDSKNALRKWLDAAAVMASAQSKGAAYIDLRAPGRPALGGLGPAPKTVSSEPTEELPADGTGAGATTGEVPQQQTQPPAQQPVTPQPQPTPVPQQTNPTPAPNTGGAGGASPTG